MSTKLINIDGQQFEVPEQVADKLDEYYTAMDHNYRTSITLNNELQSVYEAVNDLRQKEGEAKAHPFKDKRLQAWEAKINLYGLVPIKY